MDHQGIYTNKMDSQHFNKMVEGLLEEKQRQEKRYRLSNTPGGFFSYYAAGDGKLISADKTVAYIFGCQTVEEFKEYVGNTFKGMVYPGDWERIEREIKEQIAESDWNMDYVEYRIIRKDGAVRYLKDYGHLEEGEGKGEDYFQVFLLDVTDDPESDT